MTSNPSDDALLPSNGIFFGEKELQIEGFRIISIASQSPPAQLNKCVSLRTGSDRTESDREIHSHMRTSRISAQV